MALAVDSKPKRTTDLQRIRNIRVNRAVTLLVDEYDDADWSRLWWIRVDGTAEVLGDTSARVVLLGWLCDKYQQYEQEPPLGPVVRVDIRRVRAWSGTRSRP
jgi:PPOX class probable F420-dependent enzyme